jgi:hypothetical protein
LIAKNCPERWMVVEMEVTVEKWSEGLAAVVINDKRESRLVVVVVIMFEVIVQCLTWG